MSSVGSDHAPVAEGTPESIGVEEAVRSFGSVSRSLLASYERLARRAEYVEGELARANSALACKVDELDALRSRLEAILDSLPSGVVVRDEDGRITRANESALRILGLTAEEVLGQTRLDGLRGPRGGEQHAELWWERELRRPDGSSVILASRCSTVVMRSGEPYGSVEILDDRTELTRIAERMQQQSKMAALGTMAGGIAHEIRNPLNGIRGFASLLRRELARGAENPAVGKCAHWADRIVDGVGQVDSIISSMLTFAEPESLRTEVFDVRALLAEALEQTPVRALGSGSRWSIEVDSIDMELRADRIKLRQALRNLVVNAVEAQPDGGSVRIQATRTADELHLSVADAGPGIDPSLARKVADPFFTTRANGTGLGLALVHSIARLHGGRLEILPGRSALGGAELRIRIPLTPLA